MENYYIGETKEKGKGLFANRDFAVGEKIYEFPKGRLVTKDEISSLPADVRDHIDPAGEGVYEIMEAPAKYVNHSCDPNVMEKDRVGYAWKPIRKGDELAVDYRIRENGDWKLDCKCGSKNCPGIVIGNYFSLPPELQEKYLPYTLPFIREEYERRESLRN